MNSKFCCTLGLSWIYLFFFSPLPYSNRKNEFWKQFTNGAINTEQNTNNIKYQIIILAASTRSYRTLQLLQHLMISPLYLGDSKTSVVLITGSFVPLLVNSLYVFDQTLSTAVRCLVYTSAKAVIWIFSVDWDRSLSLYTVISFTGATCHLVESGIVFVLVL